MEAKYTKGPWHPHDMEADTVCGADGTSVAYCGTRRPMLDAANVRLITVAPELLEAAQALGALPEGYCFCSSNRDALKNDHEPECRDLRAAIEKADGANQTEKE